MKKLWIKLALIFGVVGPGLITSFADNDAGGITTYSIAGARYGYSLLWMLLLITFVLAFFQEMVARLAAVTGKGLSDLIREEFGLRWTLFAMIVLLVANFTTTIANFAGIAASLEILGVSKYISVPVTVLALWLLVVKGSYRFVERFFLIVALFFAAYVIAGFLAKPDWGRAADSLVKPTLVWKADYWVIFIATIGTTITPWMQFYLQSSIVDKGITMKHYGYVKLDVFVGTFFTNFISFFIIVTCAATLFKAGIPVHNAEDAALALAPIAGKYSSVLFAVGLFVASMMAASIVPLSTSYAICEAFGMETGINKNFSQAPIFFSLYTLLLILGGAAILIPGLPLIKVMLFAQTVQGVLLPVILIFILLLLNNRDVMGDHVNSKFYNIAALIAVAGIVLASLILLVLTLMGKT
ncbi:Nramp family divalent metal transporter [candidate division TA06 bacterium]|uniref:Nramp family divalent metal transporter n=1 Tax=candidate division TA06 bacterium TaxID=2250710 RepID=A0A933MKL9_UNCT6|nr:Nramp family divalent metal transporter [candidate division TA06 bacterium]